MCLQQQRVLHQLVAQHGCNAWSAEGESKLHHCMCSDKRNCLQSKSSSHTLLTQPNRQAATPARPAQAAHRSLVSTPGPRSSWCSRRRPAPARGMPEQSPEACLASGWVAGQLQAEQHPQQRCHAIRSLHRQLFQAPSIVCCVYKSSLPLVLEYTVHSI